MQTIHIQSYGPNRGTQLMAVAQVRDADMLYSGGVNEKIAEDLLSRVLPLIDRRMGESIVFTYVDTKGVPQTEEDFLFYLEPGCCARRIFWVNRVQVFRMQMSNDLTAELLHIDLTTPSADAA